MQPIATTFVAIVLQIGEQLRPVSFVIFVERAPARAFNPKPDSIATHHATQTHKRQTVVAKCLAMTRVDDIDCMASLRDDLLRAFAGFRVSYRRNTGQSFLPM